MYLEAGYLLQFWLWPQWNSKREQKHHFWGLLQNWIFENSVQSKPDSSLTIFRNMTSTNLTFLLLHRVITGHKTKILVQKIKNNTLYSTLLQNCKSQKLHIKMSIATTVTDDVYAWRILSSVPFHYCKHAWPSQSLIASVADKVSHRTYHVELSPVLYHYEEFYAHKHSITINKQSCTCWHNTSGNAVAVNGFDVNLDLK